MVMEYDDHNVHRQIEAMRVKRFTISSYSLYVYGLCSKCSAALKRKQKKILNKIEKQKNGRKKD
jgi:Fur family transcriptional regulator, ferric uptake regulator